MNFKKESGQYLLARNSPVWITLEERRAQMKRPGLYVQIDQ
jgi:hypothetical protein